LTGSLQPNCRQAAAQNWVTNSYSSVCYEVVADPLPTTPGRCWKLATCNCCSGRSGLRPSLVRGDSPRNAPLLNHRSPTVRRHSCSAAYPTWWRPAGYAFR